MGQKPPVAPIISATDHYHGVKIADPYRYMEDFKSAPVQKWVKGQAEFAAATLKQLPGRAKLFERIVELDSATPYTVNGITELPSGDLFYFKQLATENVAKLYRRDGKTGREQLLIDPESFPKSEPDQHFTLSFYRVSPDETKLVYGFAASGSEQTSLKVLDIASRQDLSDVIDRMESDYAQPTWLPDGKSFVYSRRRLLANDAPPSEGYKFTQAFHHALGDDPERASPVFAHGATGSPAMGEMDFPAVLMPEGSTWAIGQIKHGDETDISLYVIRQSNLGSSSAEWVQVCGRADLVTDFAVRGDDIYLLTARDAPRFKVIRTPLAKPDLRSAELVVPPGEYVVNSLAVAQDALYVGILDGVPSRILRVGFDSGAKPERIELPGEEPSGSVIAARSDVAGVLIRTSSWTRAGGIYRYDPGSRQLADARLLPQGPYDSVDWLTSSEVKVASHDGVEVPLSIIHRRDLELDGSHPTLISGYGAYGFASPPQFNPVQLAWFEQGGVLAVAHVRGGGAFGKPWHHAGRKLTKPNTWKDFIACAEYLVQAGYTSPERLAGQGGSAGGILIGRAITERPELFAAAHIAVGCTDMLRFETTMNGPPNIPEFGSVVNEDEFRGLLAMSTYHQIKDGTKYPAVILTHGINDPRVEPWESAKTTARLQAASSSDKPVLFRVEYHAGHGVGSTRKQRQEELADKWSFMLWQFKLPGHH